MALLPEDDTLFQWPPPHWSIAPGLAPSAPGMPAPAPEVPQIAADAAVPPTPLGPPPIETLAPPPIEEPALPPPPDLVAPPPVEMATPSLPMPVEAEPPAPVEEPESPYFDPLAPQTWDNPVGAEDLYGMAKREPVAFSQHIAADDAARVAEGREREAAVRTENAQRDEAAYQDLMDATARANEMRDQLLEQKIDASRWHKTRSPLQAIAGFLSVVIGGLYQARKGGPNIGLQIIDQAIDRDIAEQQANMANQRNAIADLRAQGMNDFQAKQAYRISWYQRALEDVKTSMQDYDPAGTTARNLVQQQLELEARIGQAAEAARRDKLKEELVLRKDARETAETMAKLREADLKYAKLAGSGAAAKRPPEYFRALGLPVPPMPMTDKEHEQWMRRSKLGKELGGNDAKSRKEEADAIEAEAKAEAAKSGYAIKNPETGRVFTVDGTPDGKPLVEMSETKRNKVSDVVTAATRMRALADKVAALRKKDGGNWKVLGSDEAQEIQSLVSQVDFETFKAFGLGAPSEGDKDLAAGVRGGVDPSSFVKNASKGFLAYADGLEDKANTELRSVGYRGPKLRFTRESDLPPPKKTERELDLDVIIKTDYAGVTTDPSKTIGITGGKKHVGPLSEEAPENIDRLFNALVARARKGDESAWKDLESIRAKAVSPVLRKRAEVILVERPK